ncbi:MULTISPECIES: hypothetical protein [unclassified Pseudomonas]|uniref:hypothetical protein n=1 Tax=unclassified Pseudomonas TaxID=196821 RepID=UPI0030DBB311
MFPLVGATERSEAAIFSLAVESRAKDQDQKIAAFGSSYGAARRGAHALTIVFLLDGTNNRQDYVTDAGLFPAENPNNIVPPAKT